MANINYTLQAQAKLKEEAKAPCTHRYGQAVKANVVATLCNYCEREPQVAEAIAMTKRSINDVLYEVFNETLKIEGNSVPDFAVYRAVLANYFPNAEVEAVWQIKVNGDMPTAETYDRETKYPPKPEPKPYTPPTIKKPEPAPKPKPKPKPNAEGFYEVKQTTNSKSEIIQFSFFG